jgi:hypothetical protein
MGIHRQICGKIKLNNIVRRYGHIFKNEEDRILKDILKMKLKRECTRGRPISRWEQPVRKDDMQKEGTR